MNTLTRSLFALSLLPALALAGAPELPKLCPKKASEMIAVGPGVHEDRWEGGELKACYVVVVVTPLKGVEPARARELALRLSEMRAYAAILRHIKGAAATSRGGSTLTTKVETTTVPNGPNGTTTRITETQTQTTVSSTSTSGTLSGQLQPAATLEKADSVTRVFAYRALAGPPAK